MDDTARKKNGATNEIISAEKSAKSNDAPTQIQSKDLLKTVAED